MTTMTLPALPPISSLESYVHAVNAIPMLTPERETALGRALREGNDIVVIVWWTSWATILALSGLEC